MRGLQLSLMSQGLVDLEDFMVGPQGVGVRMLADEGPKIEGMEIKVRKVQVLREVGQIVEVDNSGEKGISVQLRETDLGVVDETLLRDEIGINYFWSD